MTDASDSELLEEFVRNESEVAFAAIVQRHIGLVHSVALRHTASAPHAQDITQAVFIILARKANSLGRKTVLSGWLYNTARLTVANCLRAEARRINREQEAFMQSSLDDTKSDAAWQELSPLLDDAMSHLSGSDRDALVLRYFENKSLLEVGAALEVEERAAQKRVNRALEKLRKLFAKRGVTLSAVLIAGTISANSVQAAPMGLTATIAATAGKGAVVSGSTLSLIKGALKAMTWSKFKTAIAGVVGVLIVGGVGVIGSKALRVDRNNFEVEGILETSFSTGSNDVKTNSRPFKVFVKGEKWLIRVPVNSNGIKYSEESFDGQNIYWYTQFDGKANAVNSSVGAVEADNIPSVHSSVMPVWLAYGASRFFDGITGNKVRPFLVASGLRSDRDHLLDVTWQRSDKPPFVPTNIYCAEINERYRVMQFTNFDGMLVPTEFALETFPPGTGLTNAPNYVAHGLLTKIARPSTMQVFRPRLDGRTQIEDRRFPDKGSAQYLNTNKDWFSTNSIQWQTLLKLYNKDAGGLVWPDPHPEVDGIDWPKRQH